MKNIFATTPLRFLLNLIIIYIAYGICRVAFVMENWGLFPSDFQWSSVPEMMHGAWMFDTSAILYTNVLYALLMLIPLHHKETRGWQMTAKWVYIIINGVCIAANLADSVYFKYTMRRTTNTIFSEFSNEGNIGSIIGVEFLRHWYLVLLFIIIMWGIWKLYFMENSKRSARTSSKPRGKQLVGYYVVQTICFGLFIPLCICGMRGGATTAVRPITISNANQYIAHPQEAGIVLNTPFSLIRTIGKKAFEIPNYMTEEEMNALYSPVIIPNSSSLLPNSSSSLIPNSSKKNVVILIVESFGREYIGGYNKWLDGGKYKGYTPFVDSLMQHSQTFLYSYCNGRKSIDGMPSILSSIPMFVEPFFLTPASMNDVSGIAGELKNKGYYSAFFHGAENGSMGFQAFARKTGFIDYFGRTEYNNDSRFDGDKDFDGTWAIWDEPFLQFYAQKMDEMPHPFITTFFTASSHHPFVVPDKYKSVFKDEGHMINKCIRYTDNALRQFFATASKMPWFNNTLFVITSDHANQSAYEYYNTDLGWFCSPIIFYDPSGELKPGMRDAIAQQIDILPTVLGYLGYDKPFISFGCDLFKTPAKDTWAVNYCNDVYQYVKGDYVLQWDGTKTKAIYNFRTDLLLQNNLLGKVPQQDEMEKEVKAIIQSYMTRMTTNSLICK